MDFQTFHAPSIASVLQMMAIITPGGSHIPPKPLTDGNPEGVETDILKIIVPNA